MSGLVRLEPGSDIASPGGRFLLQETLELLANDNRAMREELNKVREQDKIVAPVPIEEYPSVFGIFPTQVGGAPNGSLLISSVDAQPPGYATCDGTSGTPDMRGRAPIGSGQGTGLSNRVHGTNYGAETHALVSGELASHTHDLANHTHTGPNHNHTIAHTHDLSNHTHTTGYLHTLGGGSLGPGPAYAVGSTYGTQVNHASGTPSSNSTGASSTNISGNAGTGNTGAPSNNTSGSAGSGTAHNNMQPSKALRFLMKTTDGDLDLPRVCPIFFGRVPGRFDFEGPEEIVGAAAADGYEVIEAGRPPEKISEVSLSTGVGLGASSCTLRFSVYVPYNFRRWKTAAIRLRTKLAMTGVAGASTATITLKARKPTATSGYLVGTNTRTLNESGGELEDSDWVDMVLKTTDLGDDWQPGYFLACEVTWSFPKSFTTASLKVGRLQINW